MCELASGDVVPLSVEALPVKPRRGASARIESLKRRAGPVTALHPLRVSAGETSEEGLDEPADQPNEAETDSGALMVPEPEAGAETQAEFEL